MGRETGSVTVLVNSVYWGDGIARIAILRREETSRFKRKADRALGKAEMALDVAQAEFSAKTVKFGKRSGHADYQRAESELAKAHQHRNLVKRTVKKAEAELDNTIGMEQDMLHTVVREFLNGNVPRRPECGSMRLIVSEGNLNIYFNRSMQVQEDSKHLHDGHYIIRPDGTMHSMYLRR